MRWRDRIAGAVLALAALTLAACAAAAPGSGPSASGNGPSQAVPGSTPAGAPATGGQPSAQAFEIAGASFVSPGQGWVLGSSGGCADCAGLLMTRDGGDHWTVLPPPPAPVGYGTQSPAAVTNVAFADARNGFLYGPAMLGTRDGGRSWTRDPLPPVRSFAIGGGFAYAVTQPQTGAPYELWRTAVGSGRWTRVALPRAASAPVTWNGTLTVYAEGSTVVLLRPGFTGPVNEPGQTGQLWLGPDGTNWRARPVPCRSPNGGGAAVLSIALGHPDAWLLDCFNNQQSSQEQDTQHHLFGTADGGRTWVRLPAPDSHDMPVLLADNGSGHAFLAAEGPVDQLRATFDGGLHWQTVLSPSGDFSAYAYLAFLTPQTGFVAVAANNVPEHLYRTDDGGRTWRILRIEALAAESRGRTGPDLRPADVGPLPLPVAGLVAVA